MKNRPGSASMDLDKNTVLEIIRNILTPVQLKRSLIYWDKKVRQQGEEIKIGLQTISMPFTGTMVFVDLSPAYNWAHACLYIFLDRSGEKTQVTEGSFPPFTGTPEESYVILLRYGDIPPHERYFAVFDRDSPPRKGEKK
jgi:hypothetical protein